jgi:hypothetical protein
MTRALTRRDMKAAELGRSWQAEPGGNPGVRLS